MVSTAEIGRSEGTQQSRRAATDWTALTEAEVFSLSGKLLPVMAGGAFVFVVLGLAVGFPADLPVAYLRTGLIHLPMAWLSILLLLVVAFWSALGVVLEKPLAFMMAQALAPTGGMCAFLAIWTGAFWNQAAAGVWWVGSAREIAEVMLLLIYLLIVGIPVLVENVRRADRSAAVVALIGAAQVPMLFFVVELFCASGVTTSPNARGVEMWSGDRELYALIFLAFGFWLYVTYAGLLRLRCIIVERQSGVSDWRF